MLLSDGIVAGSAIKGLILIEYCLITLLNTFCIAFIVEFNHTSVNNTIHLFLICYKT